MTSFVPKSYLGHDRARLAFCRSFARGKLHHAWILAGDKGLGKAGFARQAAHFLLNSKHTPANFCDRFDDEAGKLLLAGSHPDFRYLERGPKGDKEARKARDNGLDSLAEDELARNIKVDQIRALQPVFTNQSSISDYRVVVIDSVDDLERGAANALLKNLEEPPRNTVFLLVSHNPDRLLPTIRSRCQILRFDPLDDDQIRLVIKEQAPKIDPEEIEALIAVSGGSPGRALEKLEAGLAELEAIARQIMTTGDRDNTLKTELARKLSLKAATPRYKAFLAFAPSMIADHVKHQPGEQPLQAIEKWREASDLAAMAVPKALDAQAVVFRIGSLMGSLAQTDRRA